MNGDFMDQPKRTTSGINGPLWGERADDWANIQEGQCRKVYEAVFAKASLVAGTRYLDAGCGAGMAVQIAAGMGALVSGLDASGELLQIARQRTPSADLHQGELEELPFPDAAFDLVTGFNSFQYAADPISALRQARRVAAPGATIVIMTWGEPAGMPAAKLVAALKPLLPPAPPGAAGPFALSDPSALKAFAVQAGLAPQEILTVDCLWQYANLAAAIKALDSSGVASRARAHSGDEAVAKAHAEVLRAFELPDGTVRVGATFNCLFATR
jgi:SAM-dependent methyltransferase